MRLAGVLVLCLVFTVCFQAVLTAYCHGKPNPDAQPNMNPIWTGTPTFLNSTENGKLFTVGEGNDTVHLLHVYGTPYQMGYAHGVLLKDILQHFLPTLWAYLESQVTSIMTKVPPEIAKIIANFGLDAALDLTYEGTKDFTGAYFMEELQGLADGGNVDYLTLRRIHLIGELTKGACSMYGAWGAATKSTGNTYQLRALDWDVQGPFKEFPLIVVYHPTTLGHPFINVGFVGWIACLAGMSSTQLAISEIGVTFPDDTFGSESRIGIPFTYLMRDIIQFDETVDDSINRITSAERTCDLILGVGDGKLGYFRGFQYSHSVANVIDDLTLRPVNDTWHPQMENVVYWGMDWLCPGYSSVLSAQLQKYHGNITPQTTIQYITAITQTGDLHVVISDLTNLKMYVAFAAGANETGPQMAYDRQFLELDGTSLFAEPAPTI
eukprot:Phypoly_transcript_08444.p1 GENE.Phypoly_transcript_08444~~Phypoly_transcript_08444.p1  ORF type:complete len:437 (+),score=72.28 Phypoly_transcript_08444:68-1378(+)